MTEIVSTEEVLHGEPRIKGTRVSAKAVWEMHHKKGMSVEDIAEQLPTANISGVESALEYIENMGDEEKARITA
ncbi:MAG: DUF433 domain-containing protein [Candidatus Nanohaloarchaea archaeon]|nr:DUF433 domain-containing protein [Candidatus Nanohaloarchaea archaeon]